MVYEAMKIATCLCCFVSLLSLLVLPKKTDLQYFNEITVVCQYDLNEYAIRPDPLKEYSHVMLQTIYFVAIIWFSLDIR